MPIYRINGKIILFSHIPKTGGTSIEFALAGLGAEALNDKQFFHNYSNFSRCSAQHFHLEILKRVLDPDFVDYRFTVVRNPIKRLVSEFAWRASMREKYPLTHGAWMRESKEPEKFEDWLDWSFEKYNKDSFVFDNHLRHQGDFFDSTFDVFRIENGLDCVMRKISAVCGASISMGNRRYLQSNSEDILLTDCLIRKISDFYANDFETLEYERGQMF